MRKFMIVAAVIALAPRAFADAPEPSREQLAAAAATCTAEGAFGLKFGRGPIAERTVILPFSTEFVSAQSEGVFEIAGLASFAKAPMSGEDRVALAGWVFKTLDGLIARRGFAGRDVRRDGVTYRSSADVHAGYTLDLSHDGVNVRIACTDVALKRRAREEMREER